MNKHYIEFILKDIIKLIIIYNIIIFIYYKKLSESLNVLNEEILIIKLLFSSISLLNANFRKPRSLARLLSKSLHEIIFFAPMKKTLEYKYV